MNLLADERIEPLGNNMSIVTSDSHTFGTDAVLLADFANIRRKDIACDMGTGCGIIPLIWCKGVTNEVYGLDIQPKAISQLEKSLEINDMVGRIKPINCDLRNLKGVLGVAVISAALGGSKAYVLMQNLLYDIAKGICRLCEERFLALSLGEEYSTELLSFCAVVSSCGIKLTVNRVTYLKDSEAVRIALVVSRK